MPEVDKDLAAHCLEDLGTLTRGCKIVQELGAVRSPTAACEGWSIRDTLYEFLKQAIEEFFDCMQAKSLKKAREKKGQILGFGYSIALMDNPYRPDLEGTIRAARMEVDGSAERLFITE